MKKIYFLLSIVCLLLMTSCKKEQEINKVNTADQEFITKLAISMKGEISAAQIASSRTSNEDVKNHVQNLTTEYKIAEEELHKLAASLNIAVENMDSEEQVLMLSRLDAASGSSFDSVYMNGSVKSQQQILNIFQKAFNEGNNANVKGYVHRYIDMVEKHFLNSDRIARNL